MKVSIITVCLNSAKTIRKALDSVRNQTYKNLELVIVDGVSTDETLQIVAEFKDIVTTLVSEKDKGIFDAMNKGISLVTGDIVFFLNSDDILYDEAVLADVVHRFKIEPALDLLYGNVVPGENNITTKQTFSHVNAKTIVFEHLCHQAVFAKRAVFDNVGLFSLAFKANSDYDWLIRVFKSRAKCAWFDRIISVFSLGGMHAQDPIYLANEHKKVRLQYMTTFALFCGDISRRIKHRWHKHFKPYPIGFASLLANKTPLRVILLSHGFQAEYELGLANGLAENGVEVTLIGSDETLTTRLNKKVKLLNFRGSQDDKRPKWLKVLNLISYWLITYSYVLLHRSTPVHVMGVFISPKVAIVECWLTRFLSGKFILTIHDILPHNQHTEINAKLNKIAFSAANESIIHAEPMRLTLINEFGFNTNTITTMEVGIDRLLPLNISERQKMRAQYHIKDNEHLILTFGNISQYKGVDILIAAFNHIAGEMPARLLIVGRCNNQSLKQDLYQQIENSPYRAKIFWYEGFFPEQDMASMFHAADVFVMAYRHIYQSGALFMALATGLRTVATDVGILKNYIPPEFGQIVPPEDPIALAKGIKIVLNQDKPSAEYLHELADPYLWVNVVKPLLTVYEKLQ